MASQTDILPDRGFTGHEYLKYFNLYNMNGRLYDPLVARFLNVDPYVQMPDYTQNLNRYSYCLNNPLKYTDPSGDFFWIIPNIGWSKQGGISIGLSFVVGIPGGASAQVGVGYNFKSNDVYGYAGATLAMNTVYTSVSSQSGWSAGYTGGASIYSGLPVSTNFLTMGVNYNISQSSWSGNISAWNRGPNGWDFNPSVSAMVFPEQTTNFIRGQGFRSNNGVLSRFTANNDYQGALEYYGFEGTYDPDRAMRKSKTYQADDYWGSTNSAGEIFYGRFAFENYATLRATFTKERYTSMNISRGKYHDLPSDMIGLGYDTYLEEVYGYIHAYKNQGLYLRNKLFWEGIKLYQRGLNRIEIMPPTYPNRFNWLYKIPRKW